MTDLSLSVTTGAGSYDVSISGPVTINFTPRVPAPPAPVVPVARRMVRRWTMGANVERLRYRALSWNGKPIGSSPDYWKMLRQFLTHVRVFLPFGFSGAGVQLTKSDVLSAMPLVHYIVEGGLDVIFEAADVINLSELAGQGATKLNDYLSMFADLAVAENFDPEHVVIGSVNEPAGETNAAWAPYQAQWYKTLRDRFPDHALMEKACNWAYYGGPGALNRWDNAAGLCDGTYTGSGHPNTFKGVHDYDPSSVHAPADAPGTWFAAEVNVANWMAANGGAPVVMEEFGWTDATGILSAAQGAGMMRPLAWTITPGDYGRLNASSTDASLPPDVVNSFAKASDYIKQQPYYQA